MLADTLMRVQVASLPSRNAKWQSP